MLILIRLYPKSGLTSLCNRIESEKRNLYWEDAKPLYAMRQEGKKYLSIVLDVKNIDAVQNIFLKTISTMISVRKTRSIPLMNPVYFPLPKEHPSNMERYLVYLRVSPNKLKQVYTQLLEGKNTNDSYLTYMSYSFGDDDIILSVLSKDRETARQYVEGYVGKLDGVMAFDLSKVVRRMPMLPKDKINKHIETFLFTKPPGMNGERKDPKLFERYASQKANMTVVVRLFAKKKVDDLWKEIEENMPKLENNNLIPLYASQQEKKSYITVTFDAMNFEVLRDFLVNTLPIQVNLRKSRTVPLSEPTYFLMPKEHPEDLHRFLISLRTIPTQYIPIRSKIISSDFPHNLYMTYLSFSLGEDDILLSVLAESRKAVQQFCMEVFDPLPEITSYDISNQLRTKRLATMEQWKKHQGRFLSSYDRQHKKDYDQSYDWTNDFNEYAMMMGAFSRDLE